MISVCNEEIVLKKKIIYKGSLKNMIFYIGNMMRTRGIAAKK